MSQNLQWFSENTNQLYSDGKGCTQNLTNSQDQPAKLNQVAVEHLDTGVMTGFEMLILLPVFFLITETMF